MPGAPAILAAQPGAPANEVCVIIANSGLHGLHLGFERGNAYRHVRVDGPGRCHERYFLTGETVPVDIDHCRDIPRGGVLCRQDAMPGGRRRKSVRRRRRATRRAASRRANRR